MRVSSSLLSSALSILLLAHVSLYAQCGAPELVKGADKYNTKVCAAFTAAQNGEKEKALELFLNASKEPVLESPNIRLFGEIARSYAELGRFQEARQFLEYDNLSVLWMIGIVRCQQKPNSMDETLLQDGKPLTSEESRHMVNVLCGPAFDEFSYFRDRDATSFVPAAKAILRYEAIRKEVDAMTKKRPPDRQRK